MPPKKGSKKSSKKSTAKAKAATPPKPAGAAEKSTARGPPKQRDDPEDDVGDSRRPVGNSGTSPATEHLLEQRCAELADEIEKREKDAAAAGKAL